MKCFSTSILCQTRDALRNRLNRAIKVEELVEALKSVRWAAGREITDEEVQKFVSRMPGDDDDDDDGAPTQNSQA